MSDLKNFICSIIDYNQTDIISNVINFIYNDFKVISETDINMFNIILYKCFISKHDYIKYDENFNIKNFDINSDNIMYYTCYLHFNYYNLH